MPKLYYTPTSCGAASFIAANIAGVSLEAEQVDLRAHTTTSGADFYAINAKGNVPALVLEDGTVLNEGSAVLQYIADQAPGTIAPRNGEVNRYLVQQILNYTASEVHTAIGGLFNPAHNEHTRAFWNGLIEKRLTFLNGNILSGGAKFVVGDSITIADLYLYIVLSWAPYVNVDLTPYPNVQAYFAFIKDNAQVQAGHARIAENPTSTA